MFNILLTVLNDYLTYLKDKIAMIVEIVLTSVFCIAVFYAHLFIKKYND